MREILIDKDQILESLTVEDVKKLLESLGAEDIIDESETKDQLITNTICHNISGGSMKLYYRPSTKYFYCFTGCHSTSVFDVVMQNFKLKGQDLNLPQSIEYIASKMEKKFGFGFGFSLPDSEKSKESSEMDWMNRFNRKRVEYPEMETYSTKILDVFSKLHHPAFLNDNISHEAMNKFQICYYNQQNRIIIPHFSPVNGELIGLRGRALNQWEIEAGYKYLPTTVQGRMYNFPSYGQIYGLWQNQNTIKKLKKAVLFESEKSVLQCESYYKDNNFAISMLGRNISSKQIEMLLNLGLEEIIIATDRMYKEHGTDEERADMEYLLKLGRRFSPYIRTYVLFDEHDQTEYKSSPSDFGAEILGEMMKNKKEVLNIE